jgi:hypothetical protein
LKEKFLKKKDTNHNNLCEESVEFHEFCVKVLQSNRNKMVRSLSQWTKTLSFPARISPNRHTKDCNVNVHPITPPPAPPRKNQSSPSPPPNNVSITEISQIVSRMKKLSVLLTHVDMEKFTIYNFDFQLQSALFNEF